jgi:hypothetical protein
MHNSCAQTNGHRCSSSLGLTLPIPLKVKLFFSKKKRKKKLNEPFIIYKDRYSKNCDNKLKEKKILLKGWDDGTTE